MRDMEAYQKKLTHPEARHRYWHIKKEERNFFPPAHEIFKMEFDGKIYKLKVNHKDDVMTGQLYERYRFQEGDRVVVKKKRNQTYLLEAPDTQLYPAAN